MIGRVGLANWVFVLLIGGFVALPFRSSAQPIPIATPEPASRQAGAVRTAPVTFEGRTLFTIAAPHGALRRAAIIEENLRRIAAPASANVFGVGPPRFDSATFRVAVGEESGYPTLYATDATGRNAVPIMTLTEADAAYQGMPNRQLAEEWRGVLQAALEPAVKAGEPEYFRTRLLQLPLLIFGIVLFSFVFERMRTALRNRDAAITDAVSEVDPRGASDAPEARRLRVEHTIAHSVSWTLLFFEIAAWALAVLWTLYIIPSTRAFAGTLWVRGLSIVGIWLLFVLLNNISNFVIVRLSNDWALHGGRHIEEYSRALLRRPTIVGAAANLKTVVLFLVALAATLTVCHVSGASAITVSALIGFALSFAAQSIIKDYVTGFLILTEDQFAIGDYVSINGVSGVVEDLTLRIVQIRADDGTLVSIANGSIVQARNETSTWSRVDFRVTLALNADVEKAASILESAIKNVTARPRWAAVTLEPPQMLGVDSITSNGITLRAWIKTTPSERPLLEREVNKSVLQAFRASDIDLAATMVVPAQTSPVSALR